MKKRALVTVASAAAIAAVATAMVVGCGSTSSSNGGGGGSGGDGGGGGNNGGDAGGGGITTPGKDGAVSDTDGAAAGNPELPDGSVLPHGNQIATGAGLVINGVTSDDYVIYTDESGSSNAAYAISLAAGSKAISLGAVDDNDDVFVLGKIVVLGTSSTQTKGGPTVGAASVWTSAASAPASLGTAVVLSSDYAAEIAASSDGTHVVFIDNASSATQGDIYAAAADGTGKTLLVGSVDIAYDVCTAALGFGGAYALAAYCVVPDGGSVNSTEADGGTNVNVATVASYTGASWTAASIATNAQAAFSTDKGGTKVVVNGATGTSAYPIAGGAGVLVDATGELGASTFSPGILSSDGAHVVYTTTAQALESAATTSPASPLQLSAAGTYSDIFGLSPDNNWVVGSLNQTGQGLADLFLSSATAAGTAVALDSNADGYAFGGDLFTADSTHVVYQTGASNSGGTLSARAVTAGATATTIATNAISNFSTTGAKVVFSANFVNTAINYYADLSGVDTSTTAAPTLLVSAADLTYFLNAEKNTIVYTWSYTTGANAGLWTLAAP